MTRIVLQCIADTVHTTGKPRIVLDHAILPWEIYRYVLVVPFNWPYISLKFWVLFWELLALRINHLLRKRMEYCM